MTSPRDNAMFTARFARSIALVMMTCCVAPAAAAELRFTSDGKPAGSIAHNGHVELAEELSAYIDQISGASLPMLEKAENAYGWIIELAIVDDLPGASDTRAGRQAYRLRTQGRALRIESETEAGLTFGVYGLLQDHFGVQFLAPDFEVIPKQPTLTLPEMARLYEPTFSTRSLFLFPWGRTDAQEAWAAKNRMYPITGEPIASGHTYSKYGWGKNCPLDADYHEQLANKFKAEFAKRDAHAQPLGVGQRDYHFAPGCEVCDDCQVVLDKGGNFSDLMVMMLNSALERTEADFPNHAIITFAYFNTLAPPKLVKPHDNLWVNIVSSDYSGNMAGDQLNTIRNNPANAAYEEGLRGWPKVMDPDKLTTWHWGGNHPAHRYEWPNLLPMVDDMKLWHEAGVRSAQMQIQPNAPHLGELKNWVWMQMAWNIDQDQTQLVRQFLRSYYGEKAAPIMWEYLQTADRLRQEAAYWPSVVRWRCWRTMLRQKLLTPDVRETLDGLLEKAAAAAAEEDRPVYSAHIADARARTMDEPIIDGAREAAGFAKVKDPRDGSTWYVAGARADVPQRIDRVAQTIRQRDERGGNRKIAYLYERSGQKLHEITTSTLRADLVPHMEGRLIDLVHKPTGKSLLAGKGYHERPGVRDWFVEPTEITPQRIRMKAHLNHDVWGWRIRGYLHSAIAPTPEGDGLTVKRSVEWTKLKPKGDGIGSFSRWNLLMPEPAAARIRVVGEGFEKTFTGDQLIAASQPTDVALPTDATGDVVVEIDRGDGLVVRIETPAEAWKQVRFRPDQVGEGDQFEHEWGGDPQILAGTLDEPKLLSNYAWRGPAYWPWDRDMFPVDSRPYVRVEFRGNSAAFTEAGGTSELASLTIRVHDDGEVREVEPQRVAEDSDAPMTFTLRRTGEHTAVSPKDGAELVFVPAGNFVRGSDEGGREERPQRQIHLDGYWIYKTPVTIAQFRKFAEATGRELKVNLESFPYQVLDASPGESAFPVLVNWYDAQAYAVWVGGALPSEAQWEKAARGADGRTYPWGETWDASKVARREGAKRPLGIGTHPVGSAPEGASPYGALDMAGNVWEWVGDWYAWDYYRDSPAENPKGPAGGAFKVVRGGDVHHPPMTHRTTHRQPVPPHAGNWIAIGFRVAIPADRVEIITE